MFIRQLGLKAYIDFPGAIHTRFSHLIGTMHLAGKLCDILVEKLEKSNTGQEAAEIIKNQKINVMVAGFLHDIGHGPFSHAIDYALRIIRGQRHEDFSSSLIKNKFEELKDYGVNLETVAEIVSGKYKYPFITEIIDGSIDVDRLDFLVRDAYHVGLKYYFDIEYFMSKFNLIGLENGADLEEINLGLDYYDEDKSALPTAEIFLVTWRNMYELVYHKERSRIAEKMLEYAVLYKAEVDDEFREKLTDDDKFSRLYDESLLGELEKGKGFSKKVAKSVREGKVYQPIGKYILGQDIPANQHLIDFCKEDPEKASHELTKRICQEFQKGSENNGTALAPYIICDIVPSKILRRDILLSRGKDYLEITKVSEIIKCIKQKFELRVSVDSNKKPADDDEILERIKEILRTWI